MRRLAVWGCSLAGAHSSDTHPQQHRRHNYLQLLPVASSCRRNCEAEERPRLGFAAAAPESSRVALARWSACRSNRLRAAGRDAQLSCSKARLTGDGRRLRFRPPPATHIALLSAAVVVAV